MRPDERADLERATTWRERSDQSEPRVQGSGSPDSRAQVAVRGDDQRDVRRCCRRVCDERDRNVDVGLLLLVTPPDATALAAGHILGLEAAEDDLDVATVNAQCIQVSLLPGERGWLIPHQRGEVSDRRDVILGPQSLYHVLKVKPQVPSAVSVAKPVVEVEPVHVGDDGGHGHSPEHSRPASGFTGSTPAGLRTGLTAPQGAVVFM